MKANPLVALLAAVFVLGSSPAVAVDGVIEINQAAALAGDVTPGDAPGYPVTISERGSYRLTSNLTNAGPNLLNAIEIDAFDVTLDMNGFAIIGESSCSDTGTVPNVITCIQAGFMANGIAGTTASSVKISNGSISGMQFGAISLGTTASVVIEDVSMGSCAGANCITVGPFARILRVSAGLADLAAIQAGANSIIRDSTFALAQNGVLAGAGSVIEGSVARGNEQSGITCAGDCVVENNVAEENGASGLQLTSMVPSTVRGNTSMGNGADGINAVGGGRIVDNTVTDNLGDGIEVDGPATVEGNVSSGNFDGMVLTSNSGYLSNTLDGNAGSTVISGVELGPNLCNGVLCTDPGAVCGDDMADASEVCDGSDLRSQACTDFGFATGSLACAGNCLSYDISACGSICGDNTAAEDEVCDGTDLRGLLCTDLGYSSGSLSCLGSCDGFNVGGCSP